MIKGLRRWAGAGYRVETGYVHDKNMTAYHVMKYESVDMGNNYEFDLPSGTMNELKKYPASQLVWVCRKKEDALRYGGASDIIVIEDIHNGYILADDLDGGYLILKDK